MIEKDKVYVINMNDLTNIKSFQIEETVARKIADYFLGKTIPLQLLCRPNYQSIILKSHIHSEMMREIQQWLDSTVRCRYKYVGKMPSIPVPIDEE